MYEIRTSHPGRRWSHGAFERDRVRESATSADAFRSLLLRSVGYAVLIERNRLPCRSLSDPEAYPDRRGRHAAPLAGDGH
jgi:hypothetical protein